MWLWKGSHSFPAYFCDSSHDGKELDLEKQWLRVPYGKDFFLASLSGFEGTWPRHNFLGSYSNRLGIKLGLDLSGIS